MNNTNNSEGAGATAGGLEGGGGGGTGEGTVVPNLQHAVLLYYRTQLQALRVRWDYWLQSIVTANDVKNHNNEQFCLELLQNNIVVIWSRP